MDTKNKRNHNDIFVSFGKNVIESNTKALKVYQAMTISDINQEINLNTSINKETNKNRKNKNLEDKKNKTFYDDNINNKKALNNINNYTLPNLKLKINKRQNTFRQNIFTNLLPSQQKMKDNFEKNKTFTNFYKKNNNNIINLKNRNDLYLNSNNEIFEKKININNPTIMKYLEGINFFGPYFSYCPPCGNKNLEFYKNLEQNQCLQIIQQIKKNKGRNIIFSEDKKNKKKNENNEEINDINKKNRNKCK